MKTIIKKIIFFAIVILQPAVIKAQLKTLEVLNNNSESSVVREIKDTLWLVCNNSDGRVVFTRVNETSPTAPQLCFGYIEGTTSMQINDFEIFRDTVYFCGQATQAEDYSFAIWGYFPLSGFPYVNVTYRAAIADRFTKIDVFSVDTTTADLHVVMLVGVGLLDQGKIFDEVRISPNVFLQHESLFTDISYPFHFDDVEVTDLHVAVSSSINDGSVLFFNKPITLWTSFLACSSVNQKLPSVGENQHLEYCGNDILALAYKDGRDRDIRVLSFNMTTPQRYLKVEESSKLYITDLRADKVTEDLDLLTLGRMEISFPADSSLILHLNPSLMYNGGPIFCHKYENEKLQSLEWISSLYKTLVASGRNETNQYLRLYKYKYDDWGKCAEQVRKNAKKLDLIENKTYPEIKISVKEITMWELPSYVFENPLKIICEKEKP